jgi:type VI secretion system protein
MGVCTARPKARRGQRARATIVVAVTLAGSAATGGCVLHRSPIHTNAVVIQAAAAANDNSPTTIDLVMVYDRSLVARVGAMTAAQWFGGGRDQLANDAPRGFAYREWEVVPGERVTLTRLPFKGGGQALFAFARYPGGDPYRARLDSWSAPRIVLEAARIVVESSK